MRTDNPMTAGGSRGACSPPRDRELRGRTSGAVAPARYDRWSAEQIEALLKWVAQGLTTSEIARRFGMPRHRVDTKLAKMGDEAAQARAAHQDELVITLPKAGVRIVSKYQGAWNPSEHHMVAA